MFVITDSVHLRGWMKATPGMRTFVLDYHLRGVRSTIASAAIFYMFGDGSVELMFLATGM
jgi:hypothetical protein